MTIAKTHERHTSLSNRGVPTINERFREFLVMCASSSSPSLSERAFFLSDDLQRIRAASLKGVCARALRCSQSSGAQLPLVVCTLVAPFRCRSPNRAL